MLALQPDALLAVEPGDLTLEARRHRQFRDDNVPHPDGVEWFTPSAGLLAHVAEVATEHETPDLAALVAWASRDRKAIRADVQLDATAFRYTVAAMDDSEIVSLIRATRELPDRYLVEIGQRWSVTRIADALHLSISAASRALKSARAKHTAPQEP